VGVHNNKIKKPSQLYKFNWDVEKPLMNKEQLQSMFDIYGEPKRE
jgi:hypothetical protein